MKKANIVEKKIVELMIEKATAPACICFTRFRL
jgi:hypothetical protein